MIAWRFRWSAGNVRFDLHPGANDARCASASLARRNPTQMRANRRGTYFFLIEVSTMHAAELLVIQVLTIPRRPRVQSR